MATMDREVTWTGLPEEPPSQLSYRRNFANSTGYYYIFLVLNWPHASIIVVEKGCRVQSMIRNEAERLLWRMIWNKMCLLNVAFNTRSRIPS
jgi:hypothetical protein